MQIKNFLRYQKTLWCFMYVTLCDIKWSFCWFLQNVKVMLDKNSLVEINILSFSMLLPVIRKVRFWFKRLSELYVIFAVDVYTRCFKIFVVILWDNNRAFVMQVLQHSPPMLLFGATISVFTGAPKGGKFNLNECSKNVKFLSDHFSEVPEKWSI